MRQLSGDSSAYRHRSRSVSAPALVWEPNPRPSAAVRSSYTFPPRISTHSPPLAVVVSFVLLSYSSVADDDEDLSSCGSVSAPANVRPPPEKLPVREGTTPVAGGFSRSLFSRTLPMLRSGVSRPHLILPPSLTIRPMIQARHDHGGATDGTTNSTGSSVFHFSGGDVIWFDGWAPSSPGAIAGVAIGLFLLAIVERWLAAMRTVMEAWWRQRCVGSICRSGVVDWLLGPRPSSPLAISTYRLRRK